MSSQYRNNHYVPEWYQKKFIPAGQKDQELFYLTLKPEVFIDSKGKPHSGRAVHRQGPRKCFAEEDLYTTKFGEEDSTKIEKIFFGAIDRNGQKAVDHFANFSHPRLGHEEYHHLVRYLSTQKLRTPKGLDWLSGHAGTKNKDILLRLMLKLKSLYCAIWTECIWLIADASESETKFIISDHPVTVYNRACGPRSQRCLSSGDPEIWLNGTHTIFPLNLNKVLILTNLSWVRNPYQSETNQRPNPNPFRGALFKFTDIQTLRMLSEQEVREINFIIKSRAYQYIAAGKEEWLYPEASVSKSQWNTFGDGYLLMPDPRSVQFGGEVLIGHNDGSVTAFDEYGRTPGQPDYGKESGSPTTDEFATFHRFQGEFARRYGPARRGRSFQMLQLDPEVDTEDFHKYHLSLEKTYASVKRYRKK